MEATKIQQPNFLAKQIGILRGHTGSVTKICVSCADPDVVISASRDKSILLWKIFNHGGEISGQLKKSLLGHNHFVSDCSLSRDGGYLISSSWDRTLRLWDVNQGVAKRIFVGHTSDVTTVDFSMDNRQIVSGSRDRTIRLWNTLAVQKYVFEENGHKDCVSAVLACPQSSALSVISAGWDGLVKVWSMRPATCLRTYTGHSNAVNSLSICRDSSFLASGSKDGTINLWKFQQDELAHKYTCSGSVSCVSFNPHFFLLSASVDSQVFLYNLESHQMYQSFDPEDTDNVKTKPKVTAITWSRDGKLLYVGYNDSCIRIFTLYPDNQQ